MLTRGVVRPPMESAHRGTASQILQVRWRGLRLTLCLGRRRCRKGKGLRQVSKVVVGPWDGYKTENFSDAEGVNVI